MTDWPAFDSTNKFTFNVQLPSILSALLSGGIDLTNNKSYYVKFSNLTNQFVYEDDLESEFTNSSSCHSWVLNNTFTNKTILRGIIYATVNFSTTKDFDVGGNLTVTNIGTFKVQYNSTGGIVIQQTNSSPWFGIFSDVSVIEQQLTPPQTLSLINSNQNVNNTFITQHGGALAMSIDNGTLSRDVDLLRARVQQHTNATLNVKTAILSQPTKMEIFKLGALQPGAISPE